MTFTSVLLGRRSATDVHRSSIERHASWARDFAVVGDLDAAMEALRDVRALAGEMLVREAD
jgi:hypothetical protein